MDPTLIPSISDGTQIDQNFNLSNSEKRFRVKEIYKKYHNSISQIIKKKKINMIISLHSFNPYYKNKKIDIEFGILSKYVFAIWDYPNVRPVLISTNISKFEFYGYVSLKFRNLYF